VTNVSATPSNLWRHKRRVHSNDRPYRCSYCGKLFKINIELKRHVFIHTDAKPYSCRHCSDCFRSIYRLKAHLLKSHNEGTWFTFDTRQHKFFTRDDLKRHLLRVHTGNNKPYKCPLCDKCFNYPSNLWQHKRHVHSNDRPHHCPYCGKLFKINTELKRHVCIHTDAKPYSCRHCSDCFRSIYGLEAHLLKSHNEGTWFTFDTCQHKFITRDELKRHTCVRRL